MKRVVIIRAQSGPQGTFGELTAPGFSCFTGELPWKDNARRISCIPAGVYECRIKKSPKFGNVYQVFDIPGRSNVLIHSGNFCGDLTQDFASHVEGCILLGRYTGKLKNAFGQKQSAVLASRPTVRAFMAAMNYEPFELEIIG